MFENKIYRYVHIYRQLLEFHLLLKKIDNYNRNKTKPESDKQIHFKLVDKNNYFIFVFVKNI